MALDETRTAGESGHLSDHNSLHDFYNAAVDAGAFDEATGTYKDTYGTVIAETVLGANAATITFSSIPADYRSLELVVSGQGTLVGGVRLRFNGDTATNYDYQRLLATGTSVSTSGTAGATFIQVGGVSNSGSVGQSARITIPQYADTTFEKDLISHANRKDGTASTNFIIERWAGFWRSTAAVTDIELSLTGGNFVTGTAATLYGLKGA